MVSKYFAKIEKVISGFQDIINSRFVKKKAYNDTQGLISGEINFIDDSELAFMELKDTNQNIKKKYKYHYMNNEKEMVFRYDNAKHHPEVSTFPHHKHTTKEIAESCEPELIDVLTEIQENIELGRK